jgi:hypothetical protein
VRELQGDWFLHGLDRKWNRPAIPNHDALWCFVCNTVVCFKELENLPQRAASKVEATPVFPSANSPLTSGKADEV